MVFSVLFILRFTFNSALSHPDLLNVCGSAKEIVVLLAGSRWNQEQHLVSGHKTAHVHAHIHTGLSGEVTANHANPN